ncbi:bifunctional tRNA (5-methylaminomethyl-2-thiouridine)(34)-methyltransferase MnmD/FAD-dependent 5-carboxymethylaminomethyl-2-thiouridine(34) oxidoreductase MnmC [Campylobacter geochelonis]|uniref:5-methylaminomethyl-2-thiouridine methyltransferase n=1 Tax=Campylobacter geochelonis TaxID=1780362 RepID=A0A128ELU9_9BACT|nr:bifunctional tRNA (5-methylaminomethyl-2-thiouridine)(34)-methyltransferase MnmD/FAD-dependent 5-carboxymethylaminomethyl-2-thiouridine(34) oxidoreductase MnmC [Campylobacter geochelonis]QKF71691.1 bifunctional 5-methylaminomethyl-2-thiouridine-forming methyltransferase / FAD-dependent demodification enzyme [Campylobacter geochelonis]CZE49233.1 5-methylaminomethyl-2-thiouridine methyltransferase [Campylobacter geochelonis]
MQTKIDFKDGVAFSPRFDDIYFNTIAPLEEAKFVFSSSIDEIWQKQDSFIVAEAGFGAGLNFLTLCKKFKHSDKTLHFVSIEKYPLDKKSLTKIYEKLGAFKNLSKRLIKLYPAQISGVYRIYFKKNIILDLYFGDIKEALDNLDFKADIWFLDGFAPSKNPDMWDLEVMQKVARLSKFGSILATYSSAKFVQNNLKEAGFEVNLVNGYAKKRQMIRAALKQSYELKNIWFSRPLTDKAAKKVLIIGAGIAGIVTALKFKKAGFDVVVAEKESKIASNGSGNYTGALMPLITQKGVMLGKMHLNSFLQAVNFYKKYIPKKLAKFSGAKEFAFNQTLIKRYENCDEFFKFDKLDSPYPSIFIKDGATIRPRKTCKFASSELKILLNYEFVGYKNSENGYDVSFANGVSLQTQIIIFAMGSHSEELFGGGLNPKLNLDAHLQISSVRGQVTWIEKRVDTKFPLSAKGYVCPAIKGVQVVGATYDRLLYEDRARRIDDVKNLESVEEFLGEKKVKILGSKVGYRSYSGDRFPLIGALHDSLWFRQNYANLMWTKNQNHLAPKHLKNIYITAAHGARGLSTAIMGAELLLDYVLNRPLCVDKSIADELNPARFLVRKLKKGMVK